MEQIIVTKFPATQLVSIGDGVTLIENSDVTTTLYIGDDNSVSVGKINAIPISPQSFVVFDGTREVWGVVSSGAIAINKIQGGLSFFQSGISGSGFLINSSGVFLYTSVIPATGTLFGSFAPSNGTDSFGNVFSQGLELQTTKNQVLLGTTGLSVTKLSGALTPPKVLLADNTTSSQMTLLPTGITGPDTWHTPTPLGANWASGSVDTTCQPLQYRQDPDGLISFIGALHTTSGSPAQTIFTLPNNYFNPTNDERFIAATQSGSAAPVPVRIKVDTTGNFQIFPTPGSTNLDLYINARIRTA